jgi:hypothetical protein
MFIHAPHVLHDSALQRASVAEGEVEKANRALLEEQEHHVGPEIFLYCDFSEDLKKLKGGEKSKSLAVENTGEVDAYDIKVEDLTIAPLNAVATFQIIPRLAAKSRQDIKTMMTGAKVPSDQRHNFEMFLYASQKDFHTADKNNTLWISVPINVVFRDHGGQYYRTRFTFRVDDYFNFPEMRLEARERIMRPAG